MEQNDNSSSYPEEVSGDVVGECIPSGTDILLWEDKERKKINSFPFEL